MMLVFMTAFSGKIETVAASRYSFTLVLIVIMLIKLLIHAILGTFINLV